ncbi:MAG: YetF domain-containing protein [Albidovulum sp.]
MWNLAVPWWELLARSAVVYVFLLALLRLTGKRQVGQLAPFDLVLLLVLSNAVQNSINAGDNSLIGGLLSATALVGLNYLAGLATYRGKRLEALLEGRPEILIHNGKLFERVMAEAKLTRHELNAALRLAGCASVEEVHLAVLENNGAISVVPGKGRRREARNGTARAGGEGGFSGGPPAPAADRREEGDRTPREGDSPASGTGSAT